MISNAKMDISQACTAAEVSKSGYYGWKKRGPVEEKEDVLDEIQEIALEFPKYGYRRVTKQLQRDGIHVNHKKVLRVMQKHNLLVRRKKFRPITTQSNHGMKVYPNLIQDLEITRLNQVWVSDITYIRLLQGFVYLAVIIDLFSRKCIGWNLSRDIDSSLTLGALNMALKSREHLGFPELIHHSDQGVQYASLAYTNKLEEYGIQISMNRKGNVYDNAFAESFIKTLKTEEVYMNEYRDFEDAYTNIKQFIDEVYNKKRLHSSLGYMPPDEFEQEALNISLT